MVLGPWCGVKVKGSFTSELLTAAPQFHGSPGVFPANRSSQDVQRMFSLRVTTV